MGLALRQHQVFRRHPACRPLRPCPERHPFRVSRECPALP
ncbi:hypothetical protein EVA_17671 [gut metagenome]|uniref:Uncharacterized protein n=1 Tax=gut metagenome TaxID=749906 RepID=J9FXC6_9ZZZZ